MPIIEMHLLTGRTIEQKRRVAAEVAQAASRALDCPLDTVRILITEHSTEEFSVGGVTAEMRAQQRQAGAAQPRTETL
ncbi:4-oxalocrotonate tautomerase [Sphaerotilus hippei]|uniref:4-oxalocrotonate tautomerase n=1 Tax=Sphaerotilus hippei TaxID=744406 RepID=A0A318GYV0_9BURK|nr:tautomerase family protein [Sphaerotilus hippei]PXW92313.1 4-oxalocrotonate tautomerase [Sphaerotilus hippei]